jgi:hypothetical protein
LRHLLDAPAMSMQLNSRILIYIANINNMLDIFIVNINILISWVYRACISHLNDIFFIFIWCGVDEIFLVEDSMLQLSFCRKNPNVVSVSDCTIPRMNFCDKSRVACSTRNCRATKKKIGMVLISSTRSI